MRRLPLPKAAWNARRPVGAALSTMVPVPVVLVAPLVTLALGQVQSWVDLLARTTSNLILFPLSVLLVIGLVSGLFYIGHSIMLMRMRAHRRDPYGY